MRVMQVMAGRPHGGAEAFFERLTIALAARGLSQRAVIRRDSERRVRLEAAGVSVRELPFGGPLDLFTSWQLGREIAAQDSDVVLTWMNRAAAKTPRSRAVLCGRLGGYYDLKYYRHCTHLIGNTQDIVDYIVKQGWPRGRAHYLPNFVRARKSSPVARTTFQTPEGVPLLVALGRLHAAKAFDTLVRALVHVPEAHLWIAGDGPEEAALRQLADETGVAGRIRFLGWQEDVEGLLASADVFVCPSRHEPLGNVVIEAFAQGLPVVAAASQGPRSLIRDAKNGLLVPIDDVIALAKAISDLVGDMQMRFRLGSEGRLTYLESFTEDAVTSAYLSFFERVAG
jgi:glycosyltransferase involved in cell wall biosynthesis